MKIAKRSQSRPPPAARRRRSIGSCTSTGFRQIDGWRRRQGGLLDRLGLGPQETSFRILLDRPGLRLRAYGDQAGTGAALLIIPAPIKRAYIWDLAPPVSVVRRCLDRGMRVYLAEWTEPRAEEAGLGLDDYADRLILAALDAVVLDGGERRVLLAGHSLGGTLAAIFATLHPDRVRGLLLLEAPAKFGREAGAFASLLAMAPPASALRAAFGDVPGSVLNVASVAAAPATFIWARWLDWLDSAGNAEALQTHLRVERWTLDEFPFPGRLFEEVVEWLYRDDRFMGGRLLVGGRIAAPEVLDAPLLSVMDPRSAIIPAGSILPFHHAVRSAEKRLLCYYGDSGVTLQHVGVLVGSNAHRRLWPQILSWMTQC
jgi:polyhydroxyalkanoate synthase